MTFNHLGYTSSDGDIHMYFFSHRAKKVLSFRPSQITAANLMTLAPINYWEMQFPKGKQGGVNLTAVTDHIISRSLEKGIFDPMRTRGRGAWSDNGHVVINNGNGLIVDGKAMQFHEFKSAYTYEAGANLDIQVLDPLPVESSARIIELLELINWEKPVNATLLAGWCVIAPVCGALKWRPHVWLTGAAGTGKSSIMQDFVRRIIGTGHFSVQGETSEAGLRQWIGSDAMPVVFDEAEGEDKRSQDRIQQVLNLMRSSSSNDGGLIVKGSANGDTQTYRIRSCFAFASIGVNIMQASDKSRITVLGINKAEDQTNWKRYCIMLAETMTEDYIERLRARTVNLLPVILRNAMIFAGAISAELGDQRAGDQTGALLAGAWSLRSDDEISIDEALKVVRGLNWDEERHDKDDAKDEYRLLYRLMDTITVLEGASGRYERTIGELIKLAAGIDDGDATLAHDRLKRIGYKVTDKAVLVSSSSSFIHKCLESTPWAKSYSRILARLDGASQEPTTYFAAGIRSRAIRVPLGAIFEEAPF